MCSHRRALKIALASIVLLVLVSLMACAPSRTQRQRIGGIQTTTRAGAESAVIDPAKILAVHNRHRAERGAPVLRWSASIAGSAQSWANRLASRDRLEHSRDGLGENLWVGTAGAFTQADMVESWGSEVAYFINGRTFPDTCKGGWSRCAHYTQIIWRRTTQVGCGLTRRSGKDYFVCQYDPPGNVRGQDP